MILYSCTKAAKWKQTSQNCDRGSQEHELVLIAKPKALPRDAVDRFG